MYTYAAKVDIGVTEHQNDDRALVGHFLLTGSELSGAINDPYLLAVVCDGVGGMAQGYRAAMTMLETISHLHRPGTSSDQINNAIEIANTRIRALQNIEGLPNGLRTTIAGIYSEGDRFIVYNAGDSRVYRLRFKYLMQLSKDHSLVQDMIDMGEITPEEAKAHPQKNIINKCVGNDEKVIPRIVEMDEDFYDGDIIMMCSDGICDVLTDDEIRTVLFEHREDEDLAECCRQLYSQAIANGSQDNLSVVVIRKDEIIDEQQG